MDLKAYIAREGITFAAFAERVETSVGNLSRIASGQQRPSTALALRIERATDGDVPFDSWFRKTEAA